MYNLHFDTEIWPAWKTHGFFKTKKILIKSPLSHDLKADGILLKTKQFLIKRISCLEKRSLKITEWSLAKSHVGDGAASSKASSGKSHYSKYKHLSD